MARDHLAHWGLSDAFDEAKVKRSDLGRFSSKVADAATETASDLLDTAGEFVDDTGNVITEAQSKALDALKALFPSTTTVTITTLKPQIIDKAEVNSGDSYDTRITDHTAFGHGDLIELRFDYLGDELPNELKHHGVKGMRWGVRRDRKTLKVESAKRAGKKDDSKEGKPGSGTGLKKLGGDSKTKVGEKPKGEDLSTTETSAGRYYRLQAMAKAGSADTMSDTDLKFYNARTEALSKINKLNQTDPSWMSKTTKKVLQSTAEKTMQSISDSVANKYISGPITDAIKAAGTTPAET